MVGLAEHVARAIRAAEVDPAQRVELLSLLGESHPLYRELALSDVTHARGFVLASFEHLGLPDAALPFVLEELESGQHPYTLAAAARSVRGLASPPTELERYLRRALENLVGRDEIVSFGAWQQYLEPIGDTTAGAELERTLLWLSERDCCDLPRFEAGRAWFALRQRRSLARLHALELEDHAGRFVSFGELFCARPAIVAFFYTRCENPRKCSLTLAKLAAVQALLDDRGLRGFVQLAAITYDPLYDLPDRLRAYAEARGLRLGDDARVLRSPADFAALRRHFELGVSFVRTIVSRHRIELYLLDASGRVAGSFTRLEWSEQEVVERVSELLRERPLYSSSPAMGLVASVLLALVPKCPLCWAAYVSVLGFAGLQDLPYPRFLAPLLFGLVLLNVLGLFRRARRRHEWWPFVCAAVGALLLSPLLLGQRSLLFTLPGLLLSFVAVIAGISARRSGSVALRQLA